MPLTVTQAQGFSTNFQARFCRSTPSGGRFQNARSFGTTLLDIANTGAAAATSVVVSISGNPGTLGVWSLYGPTNHVSIPAGGHIPVGVVLMRTNTSVARATAVVTVKWRELGSPPATKTISLVCDVFGPSNIGVDTVFVPSEVELIAAGTTKTKPIGLLCQQTASFTSTSVPLPSSAFSATLPNGTFARDASAPLALGFDADPARQRDPRVVTVTAGQQRVPFICWVAETVLPGELSIAAVNADPPGADLANESVTVVNVSNRSLDLAGCVLRDEAGRGRSFTFPAGFTMPPASVSRSGRLLISSLQVHSGSGQNTATDLFWGLRAPVWNNDFDTAVLSNFAGDEIDRRFYLLSFPGRAPGQTKILDTSISVPKSMRLTETGVTLEDGDFVVLEPDPTSQIYTGNLLRGGTGPAGIVSEPASGLLFPMDGAPTFALLAQAGGSSVLVGDNTVSQLVNRTSVLKSGSPLQLLINDDQPAAFGTWGAYSCRVRVFRR